MISPDHLCVSFKLETDSEKVKERMNFAVEKYNVDLVIGNILNDKRLIFVHYNPKVYGEAQKDQAYDDKAEDRIIERTLNAHRLKFKLS